MESDRDLPANVTWMFNGQPLDIDDDEMIVFPNNTLKCVTDRLDQKGEEILGRYECVADNGYSKVTASAMLGMNT